MNFHQTNNNGGDVNNRRESMTLQEFAKLAAQCREAQRRYFEYRNQTNLLIAKSYEKLLDKAIEEVRSPKQPNLFDKRQDVATE